MARTNWLAATATLLMMMMAPQQAHAGCPNYNLVFAATADANADQAVAVDIVISSEQRLSEMLSELTAGEYFGRRGALEADFPSTMRVISLELPPSGTANSYVARGCTVFVFANYANDGEHRLEVSGNGTIRLSRDDLSWAD